MIDWSDFDDIDLMIVVTQLIFRVDSHRRAAAEKARQEEANIHSEISFRHFKYSPKIYFYNDTYYVQYT